MFPYTFVDDVVILKPSGSISVDNAHIFKRWVFNEFLRKGYSKIILDLSDVDKLDSFALGILVSILKNSTSEGGDFVLCSPNESVRKVLELTSLDKILKIAGTVSEALRKVRE
ncbi:MAG: anti-sigma factor antagonist [Thermotogaceae bacterium]|nr:anti-sigma factor antagonist [Thermotogaceae bacterium]RKX38425.1 MAG: anti-anti-sigma factor [Thermotogota bacterium]RKX50375.1 MAG: anti-anti-sigma factor [Thermotoga sp.]RKX56851.1 MAG: anti-anti-sigma factor [Thermotoga sp.]HDG62292.1 STAS domain-containing protein [Thermotoga sp.]